MAADPPPNDDVRRRVRRTLLAVALIGVVLAAVLLVVTREEAPLTGPTVDEKFAALRAERASLQARADGVARIRLLSAFRKASLLVDALALRLEADGERALDRLPPFRRQEVDAIDALYGALRDALERPSAGAELAANTAADGAARLLDRLAADDAPLVLSYAPRFVPPRRVAGELTLPSGTSGAAPQGALRFDAPADQESSPAAQAVPRYAPDFGAPPDEEPALEIEVVGSHLTTASATPVLSIGRWRGQAAVSAERLRFSVPRSAFVTDVRRTSFVTATLSLRRGSRTASFQLLFTVLPDRPGSFALDQRVRTTAQEANTLVSPEILSRAPAGETRTVRRCFDPPAGWRFDKERLRVVIVERLGWQDDISDPSLNSGSVEFVPAEEPGQVCIAVIAQPVMRSARTATIGRFEATLVRDRPSETVVKSGVRALDWREAVRVPIDAGLVEWKLYVRLFDDIDREFEGRGDGGALPSDLPFLRIGFEDGGRVLVLRADPTEEP